MTRTGIPGADELLGRGVYRGVPSDVPPPVRDGHAVVVGGLDASAAAARRLGDAGWRVTIVTSEPNGRCRVRCCRRTHTDLACATGIEFLEAVVFRRIDTGEIHACNASALFLL